MVGAGGIGCELLKTLVMSGYKDIELVSITLSSEWSTTISQSSVAAHRVHLCLLPCGNANGSSEDSQKWWN
jgi:hypothetical protein